MRYGNCAFAISFAVLTGLLAAGAADAQPAPQPAAGNDQQTTKTAKIRDNPTPRRRTNAAAKKFFKAANAYYDSACKSKEEQDRAKAAFDAAQKELNDAIAREAGEAPAVKAAEAEVRRAKDLEWLPQNSALGYRPSVDEARAAADEARVREEARIRERVNEAQSPAAPRQTSCGPGGGNTSVLVAARPVGADFGGQVYRTVRIELRSAEPRLFPSFEAGGSGTAINVPTVNAGTVFRGGTEIPIITSASRLNGGGGFLTFTTPGAGPIQNIVFTGTFDQASASSNGFVAPGTDGVAQTYIFANPASGSTGINAGASGQIVSAATQVREFTATVAGKLTDYELWRNYQVGTFFHMGMQFRNGRRVDSVTQQSVNFAGLNSVIDLTATSNFVAPYFGAGIERTAGGPSGLIAGLSGFVAPGARMTSADATQISNCVPCGGGSPERSVTLQRGFSETKFAVVSGVSGYLGYQIGPGLRVVVEAAYENQTAAPVFSVPTTPTQQPIALTSGSVDMFRLGGKLNFSFPPPSPSP